MGCSHAFIVGDNYGRTCGICGQVLEGFGYWAEGSRSCVNHSWVSAPEDKYETCLYCFEERLKGLSDD